MQFRQALSRPMPAERDYLEAQFTGAGVLIGQQPARSVLFCGRPQFNLSNKRRLWSLVYPGFPLWVQLLTMLTGMRRPERAA